MTDPTDPRQAQRLIAAQIAAPRDFRPRYTLWRAVTVSIVPCLALRPPSCAAQPDPAHHACLSGVGAGGLRLLHFRPSRPVDRTPARQ